MKVKEMIRYLNKYSDDREVVLHHWTGTESLFLPLIPAATPTANSKNMIVLITDDLNIVTPVRPKKRER